MTESTSPPESKNKGRLVAVLIVLVSALVVLVLGFR
jgi:hypothetical protein